MELDKSRCLVVWQRVFFDSVSFQWLDVLKANVCCEIKDVCLQTLFADFVCRHLSVVNIKGEIVFSLLAGQ